MLLQTIRDSAKGWVAYAIIGFISIPFALFGIESYFNHGGENVAASVNGQPIAEEYVNRQMSALRRQFGQFGANMPDAQIRTMAVESLISRELLEDKAQEQGYRASDAEVAAELKTNPNFQRDGKFSAERYAQYLHQIGASSTAFESDLRAQLTLQQLSNSIPQTTLVTKEEAALYHALQNQVRNFEQFTISKSGFENEVSISDEEINTYYQENGDRFMSPERVKIAYLEVNQEKFEEDLVVTDADLQAYYESNMDRYSRPPSRKVSHIVARGDSPKAKDEAKVKIEDVLAKIKAGEWTFEEAATNHNDDKVAAKNNGQIGEVVRGDWGQKFEDAVFSATVGEVSGTVETESGWEIIRVESETPSQTKTFEEAKGQVDDDYRAETVEAKYMDIAEAIQNAAYESSGDLAPAAEAGGVELQTTEWLTRSSGEGIASDPQVREMAFAPEILEDRKNSEAIELGNNHVVFLRVVEHEAPQQQSLEIVKADIQDALKAQKVAEMMVEKSQTGLDALKASGDWSFISDMGLGDPEAVETKNNIARSTKDIDPSVIQALFALPTPKDGEVEYGQAQTAAGDYVLIKLTGAVNGSLSAEDAAINQLRSELSRVEANTVAQALRDRSDVSIRPLEE